jgi:hypothetical protein
MQHGRIPGAQWRDFFAEFSVGHRGWKAAVELVDCDCVRRRLAEGECLVDLKGASGVNPDDVTIRLKGSHGNERSPIVVESVDSAYFIDFGPGMDSMVELQRQGKPSVLVHVWRNPERSGG